MQPQVNLPSYDPGAGLEILPLEGRVRESVERAAVSPDILAQHHPVWGDILAECGEKMLGVALLRDGELAGWMMAAARESDAGTALTSLPYVAYGGPALLTGDVATSAALIGWFGAAAEAVGAGAASIGISPFTPPSRVDGTVAALAAGDGAFRFDNFAQVQALAAHPLSQLPKSRRDKLASGIRRAEREGVEVGPCEDAGLFREWLDVYRARYDEIGARPLPDRFHQEAFVRGREAGVVEFWAASHNRRLLGGSLFLLGYGVVDYFSSAFATDQETRLLSPNNLLLARAFESFAARGKSWFNWQSSPGREGVYRFKAGWGAQERPQSYVGRILPGAAGERITKASPVQLMAGFPARFVLPFSCLASQETST